MQLKGSSALEFLLSFIVVFCFALLGIIAVVKVAQNDKGRVSAVTDNSVNLVCVWFITSCDNRVKIVSSAPVAGQGGPAEPALPEYC